MTSLSPPAARQPVHDRDIACRGFRREDGLWDIEARITDVKHYDFPNRFRNGIKAGEPIHEMMVRATIDDSLTIVKLEAVTINAPFAICPEAAPWFSGLEGLTMGPGFMGEVRRRFGGLKGCTHIVELMGPLATTAFQTVIPLLRREKDEGAAAARPRLIDSCHAWAADGPVVAVEFPEFSTGKG